MKIVLVCIAKNEDNYIQEWVDYHLKLGFDNIVIYENDWDSNITNDNVIKIKVSGVKQQIPSYNNFIKTYKEAYDWCAFIDVDEFLVLKKHKNIHDFITDYKDQTAIGINWVLFGDSNLKTITEYSVIKRFIMREDKPNVHIKSIVNLKKCNQMWVHHHAGDCVDTNLKQINNTPFNSDGPIDIAQINHYFTKTKEEFINKRNRGRADNGAIRKLEDFDDHNFNDIEDLSAYNFYFN